MAIFDAPFKVAYADYNIYFNIDKQTTIPHDIVSGNTENTKTINQIVSYIGDVESFVNELV